MLTNLISVCTLHAYIGKKQTLVFLIHAHFVVTTVLSNVLSNLFFQQNELTITFNKMITSGTALRVNYLHGFWIGYLVDSKGFVLMELRLISNWY